MCGRYTLTDPDPARIRARFGLDESAELEEEPRYNIAPTDPVLAIRRDERGGARAGTAALGPRPRPLGRAPLGAAADQRARRDPPAPARLRRVVPRAPLPDPGRRLLRVARRRAGKTPIWVSRPDGDLFAFAGVWAALPARDGSGDLHSCAIVTCEPNELIRPIHDRMPVILSPTPRRGGWSPTLARRRSALPAGAGAGGAARGSRGHRRGQRRPRGRPPSARPARGAAAAVLAVPVPRAEEAARPLREAEASCSSVSPPRPIRRERVVLVLSGQGNATDRALLLDVPVLAEAHHRDRDQEQLHGHDEDASAGR